MNETAISPEHGDGDEGEEQFDLDLEPEQKDYPWTTDPDEMLRSFIFQTLADSNSDVFPSLEHMQACFQWIRTGDVPTKSPKRAPHIKQVIER